MEYGKIISVTGMPGLYELLSSKNDGAIVRSLDDKSTKFVSSRIHNFSHLESIEIYTVTDNVNLVEVFQAMEQSGEAIPDGKDAAALKKYFEAVYPTIDFERVYTSDLKKMAKWLQVLKANNVELKLSEAPASEDPEETEEEPTDVSAEKKTASGKAGVKKEGGQQEGEQKEGKSKKKAATADAGTEATQQKDTSASDTSAKEKSTKPQKEAPKATQDEVKSKSATKEKSKDSESEAKPKTPAKSKKETPGSDEEKQAPKKKAAPRKSS